MFRFNINVDNEKAGRFFIVSAVLLIIAGIIVRTIFLGGNPVGFNQDEASAGYEAYALLNYGMDRNGQSFPAMFIAWGSGQNVLYSYLSMPFIAVFGLTPFSFRLLAAVAGCMTMVIFFLLCRRLRGEYFALTALFLLVINPWHIMISRWALESNLLPFMLLLGIYFLSLEGKYFIIPAAICFGLSLYAYTTAFMFLPVFLLFCIPRLIKNRNIIYIPAAIIFIIIALPITSCLIINKLSLPAGNLFVLTLPVLTEGREMTATILGSENMLLSAWNNFKDFLWLLTDQGDGHGFNSIQPYGLYYFWGLPVSAFGIYLSIKQRTKEKQDGIMLAALFACIICAFLIKVNINRMNMIFLPLLYFNAVCIHWLIGHLKRTGAVIILIHAVAFCFFINTYFTSYKETLSRDFFEGLGSAITAAGERELTITNSVNMPYIYVLFYNRIPVNEFIESVEYYNPDGAFRWVRSFSTYSFGIDGNNIETDRAYIFTDEEKPLFESGFTITKYENFYLALPE